MGWSLLAFYSNAAKNGLTNLPPVTDNTQYIIDSTNYMKFARDGFVFGLIPRTAAITNYKSFRARNTLMRDYVSSYFGIDQTRQLLGKQDILPCLIPVKNGDVFECQADNGNNAQVEALGILFGQPIEFLDKPPAGAEPYRATATSALTGGSWSDPGSITWDKTFDKEKNYQVVGLMAYSATGYFMRLVYQQHNWRPGIPVGDNAQLQAAYFGDFGSFKGNSPPTFEFLASDADDDVYVTMWLLG